MMTSSGRPENEIPATPVYLGFSVLLAVFLLVPLAGAQSSSSLEQARARLKSGQLEEAHRFAEMALRENPRNPRVHLLLGSVLLLQGQDAEAEKSFEFALALDQGLRPELGQSYLLAAERSSDLSRTETYLSRAFEYDPQLRPEGIEAVLSDGLARYSAGEVGGKSLVQHWLSRFPDYVPGDERDLFSLATYYREVGKLAEAKALYTRCAKEFPRGELGQRASKLLQPRRVTIDRILSAPCSEKLFVKLRGLELGFDSTRVELSLVWASGDRSNEPIVDLRISPNSRIEISGGAILELASDNGGHSGRKINMRTDALYHLTLDFPPVPRDQQQITLVLANNRCGTSGRWGSYVFRFADLSLEGPVPGTKLVNSRSEEKQIPVFHYHDYFVAAGRCSGTLTLSPEGISYRSQRHGFDLPCEDIIRVVPEIKYVSEDVLERFDRIGHLPMILIEGRVVTKKGKEKTETWHFLTHSDTHPVLLLSKNPCHRGR